jgi:hypothetical protein
VLGAFASLAEAKSAGKQGLLATHAPRRGAYDALNPSRPETDTPPNFERKKR